jgi:hypothetical protein
LQDTILEEKQKGFTATGYTMNRFNNYCGQWIKTAIIIPILITIMA